MRAKAKKEGKKPGALRWKGVMESSPPLRRRMTAVMLAVAGFALTFTQLGFFDVTWGETEGYAVTLLQIVALGSLLLGTGAGTVLGLFTGLVLYGHAQLLPLDHYELSFITPVSSIVMFGISGLLMGVMFSRALRNNPGKIRRVVRICLICFIVSWIYSITFAINSFGTLVVTIVERMGGDLSNEEYIRRMLTEYAIQLGNVIVQATITAIIMACTCIAGDYGARTVKRHRGALGLRSVFGIWLGLVVALTFMMMSAAIFAGISGSELREAEMLMRGEVSYLCSQYEQADTRNAALGELFKDFDADNADQETLDEIEFVFSDTHLLQGYTVEDDGTIIVTISETVYQTDNSHIEVGTEIEDALGEDGLYAVEESLKTGRMQRFIYAETQSLPSADGSEPDDYARVIGLHPQLVYIFAQRAKLTTEWGAGYRQLVIMMKTSEQVFARRGIVMAWMIAAVFVLQFGVFIIVFQLLDRVVARRIDEENAALALITAGELDTRAEAGGTREFESLSEGINITVDTLKGWIAEAETRMDAELATARAIQEATLPRAFPPFPDIPKFDIYASMNAAKEVGGDFYDFFLVDDESGPESGKLGIVMADVSGKGIPAALFMMKAKALLHDYMMGGLELGKAVAEANRQLCDGNDEGMFVTAWVGVLDYGTGHLDYVNAGHNPPLLRSDGTWSWMEKKSGLMLGLYEVPYRMHSLECKKGDTLLLYTDGVTEAFDEDEKLYGEDRLLAVAENHSEAHPRELLEAVRADVAAHVGKADQSDDITILTLEVGTPPEITFILEVPANIEELDSVYESLHAELDARMCPPRAQNQLDVAIEELFVNVCSYAYPQAKESEPGTVRIKVTFNGRPTTLTMEIVDEGIPYNPLAKPDAVTPRDIADVPIGGLGILMAKKLVDEMRYRRENDRNIVTIVKRW